MGLAGEVVVVVVVVDVWGALRRVWGALRHVWGALRHVWGALRRVWGALRHVCCVGVAGGVCLGVRRGRAASKVLAAAFASWALRLRRVGVLVNELPLLPLLLLLLQQNC